MTTFTIHAYIVRVYNGSAERTFQVQATSAVEAMRSEVPSAAQNYTTRHQASPIAADRDNCHAQFNAAGTKGIAVRRADVDLQAAEHRNDVAVARNWVAEGRALADLQQYGGYKSVTLADLETV